MKDVMKCLMVLCLLLLMTGCATRIGSTQKLDGYDARLGNLAVVYSTGNFSHKGIAEKLERYNFQNMGEYVSKAAARTFPNYGINASVYTKKANADVPTPKEKQILFISPVSAEAEGHNGVVGSGPSMTPVKVRYEVNIFDGLINKEVWKGDFYVVAGGLLYSAFDEEKATSLLNDILGKLESDGLVQKVATAQK